MKTITKLLGIAVIALMLLGCNEQTQQATQDVALEGSRPFITKWQSTAGETLKIPIIGTYTLTWYNEATPNERHTEQVTVSTKIFKEEEDGHSYEYEAVSPYTFTTPTDGIYVVEAGPEGVEGMLMSFENAFDFAPRLLTVVQFGDVVWRKLKHAFFYCENMQFFEGIDTPNLSQCTSLEEVFFGCKKFNSPIEHWDVSHVTNMERMFDGCKAFNQPLEKWDVSHVTNMESMFNNCEAFNQPLEKWNVSKVTDMTDMFGDCKLFNQPLGKWDVSNVKQMASMFSYCDVFNQPIGQWNVSKVKDMEYMFWKAATFNQPLEDWDVSNVENMGSMFDGAKAFNQPLEKWNVGNVMNMDRMFAECDSFNQPLEKWDVSNVIDMNGMFRENTAFNQPLGKWKLSKMQDMGEMFFKCSSFNQSLGAWDLKHVWVLARILDGCPAADLPFMKEWKEKGYNFDIDFVMRAESGSMLGAYETYLYGKKDEDNNDDE